jgi:NADPH:quinone reductase-like Zn-dependent oxidoreductase
MQSSGLAMEVWHISSQFSLRSGGSHTIDKRAYRTGNSAEPEEGTFADIIAAKEHATMHKPDFLSFREAASLGAGLATVGQVLSAVMKLPFPSSHRHPSS